MPCNVCPDDGIEVINRTTLNGHESEHHNLLIFCTELWQKLFDIIALEANRLMITNVTMIMIYALQVQIWCE